MTQFHVIAGAEEMPVRPAVRLIEIGDLYDCLRAGLDDFLTKPSHVMFIVILYPIIGAVLMAWTSGADTLPLLFPLLAGFALVGPFAALPLYEISRRREIGADASPATLLRSFRGSAALPSIAAVGFYLVAIFVSWLIAARLLYVWIMDAPPPTTFGEFLKPVLTSAEGWWLIATGNLVGFAFALLVLATTSVAFPMLVDRDAGAYAAIRTSTRVFWANPIQMLAWGLIVAVLLALAMLPLFAGLIVVLPVLGHATWHLYRRSVATG